jgi:hypothetical protein
MADICPCHVAAVWLGHSVEVAKGHYWQVTEEHFDMAITPAAPPAADIPTPEALHAALQQAPAPKRAEGKRALPLGLFAEFVDCLQVCTGVQVGDEGLEPPTSSV